jgi:hypothetical protein
MKTSGVGIDGGNFFLIARNQKDAEQQNRNYVI